LYETGRSFSISANPYLSFYLRVDESGTLLFTWKDDDGAEYSRWEETSGRSGHYCSPL